MGTENVDTVAKVDNVTFDFELPGSLKIDIFTDTSLNREEVGLSGGQIKRNPGVLQRISPWNANNLVSTSDFNFKSVASGTRVKFATYVDLIQIRIAE